MALKHLTKAYNNASETAKNKGLNWYRDANLFAETLSNQFKVDFDKVCAVISALSPACSWEVNKKDAKKMILCYVYEVDYQEVNFSTYGANVVKAWNILNHFGSKTILDRFFSLKTGAKTYNFYLNIKNPLNRNYVTIDRHAIAIFEGRINSGSKKVTKKQYEVIADAYKKGAKRFKISPCQFHAILWESHVNG